MIRLLLKNGMTLSLPNKLKLSEISKNSLLKGLLDPYEPEDSEKLSQKKENEAQRHVHASSSSLS